MRRIALIGCAALFLSTAALAQRGQPPAPKPTTGIKLHGEEKLKYIGKQLDLNEKQQQLFDALLDAYRVAIDQEKRDLSRTMDRIRVLSLELQEARNVNDQKRIEEAGRQLNELRSGVKAEGDFYKGLLPDLTEEQKKTLASVRERVEKPGGIEEVFNPAVIFQATRKLGLTPEQTQKLGDIQKDFREKMGGIHGDVKQRNEALDQLIKDIRPILTADQVKQFDQQVERMRPPPLPTPGSQPAPPPAPEKKP